MTAAEHDRALCLSLIADMLARIAQLAAEVDVLKAELAAKDTT